MSIDVKKLQVNVNLHALQPGFLNSELHYIIASDEGSFRFTGWEEEPSAGEEKFYCFLTEEELFIPSGNITLKESYELRKEPAYPVVAGSRDILLIINTLPKSGISKAIRRFATSDIDTIINDLKTNFDSVASHVVKSEEGQHLLIAVNNIDISISGTMVYFRYKPF